MAKQLHISIPKPCHENWNDMTPNAQGAFCKSCQKNVIDFSTKTENEIYEIISGASNNMCGRFTTFQLQQPIRKTELNNSRVNWKAIAASLAAFFSLGKLVSASDTEQKPKTNLVAKTETTDTVAFKQATTFTGAPVATVVELPVIEKITVGEMVIPETAEAENHQRIKGKVLDAETNEELISAVVKIKGTQHSAVTDFNGDYELTLDSIEMQEPNLQIEVSYIGYEKATISVSELKKLKAIGVCAKNPLVITAPLIKMRSQPMMGVAVITHGKMMLHRDDEEHLQDRYDPKLDIRKKVRDKAKKD